MYNTGLIVVNCRAVVEAANWLAMLEEKAKAARVIKKEAKSIKCKWEAQTAHADWVAARRPVDLDGNPCLKERIVMQSSSSFCRGWILLGS